MRADRRIGVILVLVGVGLPLALLPFADYYFPERGFLGSLSGMEISLWQTKPERPRECPPDMPIWRVFPCFPIPAEYFTVPYRYFFALGVVLFLGGLGLLILARMRNEGAKVI